MSLLDLYDEVRAPDKASGPKARYRRVVTALRGYCGAVGVSSLEYDTAIDQDAWNRLNTHQLHDMVRVGTKLAWDASLRLGWTEKMATQRLRDVIKIAYVGAGEEHLK